MECLEYLNLCGRQISKEEYLALEEQRKGESWMNLLKKQEMKCYYCKIDLRVLQELLFNKIVKPRKRGKYGYSGMHLELDHKDANNKNNDKDNLVASCYYCNNDKSNTISHDIFKQYFGQIKANAFNDLIYANNLFVPKTYRHHLKKPNT